MRETDINTKVFEIISNVPEGQFVFIENIESGISNWSKEAVEYLNLPGDSVANTKDVMLSMTYPDDRERIKLFINKDNLISRLEDTKQVVEDYRMVVDGNDPKYTRMTVSWSSDRSHLKASSFVDKCFLLHSDERKILNLFFM